MLDDMKDLLTKEAPTPLLNGSYLPPFNFLLLLPLLSEGKASERRGENSSFNLFSSCGEADRSQKTQRVVLLLTSSETKFIITVLPSGNLWCLVRTSPPLLQIVFKVIVFRILSSSPRSVNRVCSCFSLNKVNIAGCHLQWGRKEGRRAHE